jgi:hypothetical protein
MAKMKEMKHAETMIKTSLGNEAEEDHMEHSDENDEDLIFKSREQNNGFGEESKMEEPINLHKKKNVLSDEESNANPPMQQTYSKKQKQAPVLNKQTPLPKFNNDEDLEEDDDLYVSDNENNELKSEENEDEDQYSVEEDDEENLDGTDEFGMNVANDRCRACDEAFGTGKNTSGLDNEIDKIIAEGGHSLSLKKLIDVIYNKVEKNRRKHNSKVTDPKDKIDVWSKTSIRRHLLVDMVRLDMQIKNQHEINKKLEDFVLSKIRTVNDEGRECVDYKAIDAIHKIFKATRDNTKLNPEASYTYVSEEAPKRNKAKMPHDVLND